MENINSLNDCAVLILNKVFENTNFDKKFKADSVFNQIEIYLPLIATKDKHGIEIVLKYSSFASNVTTLESMKDMVKIIWRSTKVLSGQPQYKLSLLIIALAALVQGIKPVYKDKVEEWLDYIAHWLGCQLTIGGKGIVGEGEGDVIERINQFFSTPYLHDFD